MLSVLFLGLLNLMHPLWWKISKSVTLENISPIMIKQVYRTPSDWRSPENTVDININTFLLRVFKCNFYGNPLDLSFLFLPAV